MIGQLLTSSYEQAVIDNEIFAAAFQLARGIEVSPETLAVDQIKEAGPGGQFLTHPFTLYNYRRFQWQPVLTTRQSWDPFQRIHQGKDMRQRANDAARKLLAAHHPRLLDEAQEAELDRMAEAFQRRAERASGS
jgi:trimethylamine--corrinoid protein Co-methyltransferase